MGFYEHVGFVTFGRSRTDDAGEPFLLLRMRLQKPSQANDEPNAESAIAIAEGNAFLASGKSGRFADAHSLIESAMEQCPGGPMAG